MSDLYYTADDMDLQDEEVELIIPTTFEEALSYAEQLIWLYKNKQAKLVEGDNIALTDNPDGTVTISATIEHGEDGVGISTIVGTIGETGTTVTVTLTDGRTQQFFVERGLQGEQGEKGDDGFSPIVSVTDITGGHTVSITDATGTVTFDVMDGADGQQGSDGYSPTVSVTDITGGHQVTIVDAVGSHTFNVMDGVDGVSPVISVTTITGGHRVTVTDSQGTTSFDVMDGEDGQQGADGYSPTVTVTTITGGHRVAITDATGTTTFDVMDGQATVPTISASASIGSGSGTPSVSVSNTGTTLAPNFLFHFDGLKGTPGTNGTDGISPTVTVTTIAGGHQIEIVSAGGTERFDVMDGVDGTNGTNGRDGISPTVTVTTIAGGHQIEIVSAGGTERFDVMDGNDGAAATIAVGTVTTGAAGTQASVTNSGTSTNAVFDFVIPQGQPGAFPSGGLARQSLIKTDSGTDWKSIGQSTLVAVGLSSTFSPSTATISNGTITSLSGNLNFYRIDNSYIYGGKWLPIYKPVNNYQSIQFTSGVLSTLPRNIVLNATSASDFLSRFGLSFLATATNMTIQAFSCKGYIVDASTSQLIAIGFYGVTLTFSTSACSMKLTMSSSDYVNIGTYSPSTAYKILLAFN